MNDSLYIIIALLLSSVGLYVLCVFIIYLWYISYTDTPHICNLHLPFTVYIYMSINAQQIFVINDNIILSLGSEPYWSIHFTCSFLKAGRARLGLKKGVTGGGE